MTKGRGNLKNIFQVIGFVTCINCCSWGLDCVPFANVITNEVKITSFSPTTYHNLSSILYAPASHTFLTQWLQ